MSRLLFEVSVVLSVSLVCGWVARAMGQARVVGEIVGGILIGPSVLGRFAPGVWAGLFPQSSLAAFDVLSTVGLILFLFVIGSELDYRQLRRQRLAATLGSLTSMALPFGLAVLAAPLLRRQFGMNGTSALAFTLFLGISLSITAFPVLARILEERGMQTSALGTTAILCAAVDDVSAWCLLAMAMTLLPAGHGGAGLGGRLLWLGGYLAVMLLVVRPLSARLARGLGSGTLSYELMGVLLAVAFASAAVTDAIGVHPLFGAFLAGMCFPRVKAWQEALRMRLDVMVSLVLLPLFFALTGMRTRLDLLVGGRVWLWMGVVLVLAVSGKVGGAVMAARWTGHGWRDALALGALLNTRGLVELVVLNIAFEARVFSPALFTILVMMALVTTGMTVPLLNWFGVGKAQGRDLAAV